MIKRIFGAIASCASILSLALLEGIPVLARAGILIVGIAGLIYLLYDAYQSNNYKTFVCKSEREINDYMYKWVKSPGKVCIMSRDLSWVDSKIEKLLIKKKESTTVFIQNQNALTKRLSSAGVNILSYCKYNFDPQSRFTIIRCNKADKQIAIANTIHNVNGKKNLQHTIYQTNIHGDQKDVWILSLASDLADLLKVTSNNR